MRNQGCTLAALFALLSLASACTYTARIRPPSMAGPVVTRLPLSVGAYFGEELRRYELDEAVLTDRVRVPVGAASIPWFEYAFAGTFVRVQPVTAWPAPAGSDSGFDAVIELRLVDVTHRFAEVATLCFELVLFSSDGTEIARWPVEGTYSLDAAMRAASFFEGLRIIGKSVALEDYLGEQFASALRQAVTHFLRDFREQPAVREWLEARDAFRRVLPEETLGLPPDSGRRHDGAATVLVLGNPDGFGECLARELAAASARVVTAAEMRDRFYPWLEPPLDPQEARLHFLRLAGTPRGVERLRETGLRYVIGLTSTADTSGFWCILCGAGFGAAGCLGVAWGSHKTTVAAAVSDLYEGTTEARQAEESGGFLMPAFILPVPLWWNTKAEACADLGMAIRNRIASGSPGPDTPTAPCPTELPCNVK
jgi:hypothetical protein